MRRFYQCNAVDVVFCAAFVSIVMTFVTHIRWDGSCWFSAETETPDDQYYTNVQ
jgi:hypothetical protein